MDRTGVIEVEYRLNKDDKSHTLEQAVLDVGGSGGLVERMKDLHSSASTVADFQCRKTVRFTEYDPGLLSDTMTRRDMSIYDEQNRVTFARFGHAVHASNMGREYGLTSLGAMRLKWSDITAK